MAQENLGIEQLREQATKFLNVPGNERLWLKAELRELTDTV